MKTGFARSALALAIGTAAMSLGVSAQDDDESGIGLGPGLRLQPALGTEVWYTDNRFYTDGDEISETGLRFDPSLILSYAPSSGVYKAGYKGQIDPIIEDDYDDHEFFVTADARPLLRHRFEFDARHKEGHDALGLFRTEGTTASDPEAPNLDEWESQNVGGQYTFGAPEARINVSLRGAVGSREYQTNRDITQFLDHDSTTYGAGATMRVGARTQLVLDYQHQEFDYDVNSTPSFDSKLDRILTGLRWMATAKTSGEVLVGFFDRNFDSDAREDADGVDWRARINWQPASRSLFTLTTGRGIEETFLLGEDFLNDEYAELTWRQDWTQRFHSRTVVGLHQLEYEGLDRDDETLVGGVSLFYQISRHVTVKGGFRLANRDSSATNLDYERYVLFQGFEFEF